MKSLRVLSAALFVLFPMAAHSEVSTEIYCFRSQESAKSINFELRTYYDSFSKWSGAAVRYSKSKKAISLVYRNTEQEILAEDRPYQFTTTWVEVSEGALTGEYEIVSQGARVYGMTYTNYKTGKKYSFEHDFSMDFSSETGCQW
ncbi:hypothetical protein [Pseudomonas glycinae]|uniref:hypothetical protein n=1 Tax=Pseudomonas glycinae TaxID=1785145 RepID=UPI002B1CEB79|nr:hypothetical protein [Pseudomonas glycinae]